MKIPHELLEIEGFLLKMQAGEESVYLKEEYDKALGDLREVRQAFRKAHRELAEEARQLERQKAVKNVAISMID
jgi:hypothetical protein